MRDRISRRKSVDSERRENLVSGTIEAATQKIKGLCPKYIVLLGQQSKLIQSESTRTIRVTIIGADNQVIILSSLATVYNALFCGPGKNESYRNIELIRNNKVYTKVDLYKFLVNGDQSENVGLKDNDVIRIPGTKE
jgi:protein involved in polysaccharide export with SLBB domain